jgi:hypothetical protein
MQWMQQLKDNQNGGNLGHIFVHRPYIAQQKYYSPDVTISSGLEIEHSEIGIRQWTSWYKEALWHICLHICGSNYRLGSDW